MKPRYYQVVFGDNTEPLIGERSRGGGGLKILWNLENIENRWKIKGR